MFPWQDLPSKAALVVERDDVLMLENPIGESRLLPSDLYEELSDISDAYDPLQEFIGFVDPVKGVVIVDAAKLLPEQSTPTKINRTNQGRRLSERYGNLSSIPELKTEPKSPSSTLQDFSSRETSAKQRESPNLIKCETPEVTDSDDDDAGNSPRNSKFNPKKTMHQLAYEEKMGHPVPDDETRPISGFGIRKGKLIFNSTTFNAFSDDFHSEDRTMGDYEKEKLFQLVNKLNDMSRKTQRSMSCSIC